MIIKKKIFALLLCLCLFVTSFASAGFDFVAETIKADETGQLFKDENLNISYYLPNDFSETEIADSEEERFVSKSYFPEDFSASYTVELEKNPDIKNYDDYINKLNGLVSYKAFNINGRDILLCQDTLGLNYFTLVEIIKENYLFKLVLVDLGDEAKTSEENEAMLKQIYASVQDSLPNINLNWADERSEMVFK